MRRALLAAALSALALAAAAVLVPGKVSINLVYYLPPESAEFRYGHAPEEEGWFRPVWGVSRMLEAQPNWLVGGRAYSTRDLMGRRI